MFKKYDAVVILTLLILTVCALAFAFLISNYGIPKTALAEPIASIEVIEVAQPYIEPQLEYLGEFTITGYCPCSKCCGKWAGSNTASGTVPTPGKTIGTDWTTIAPGTEVYIEGYGYRTVEDKPANWIIERYSGKIIDVFCATHEEALAVGRQVVKVYKVIE